VAGGNEVRKDAPVDLSTVEAGLTNSVRIVARLCIILKVSVSVVWDSAQGSASER
jgi:hypothetical protein